MRIRINYYLKRLISICAVLTLLFSTIGILGITAHAAENSFEEVTLSLNSSVVNDPSIDLYLYDSVYYISIDDLCLLTRCSKTFAGNIISVKQGFWSASFDVASQTFDDGYQTVDTSILKVSKDTYAVPALMFLSYYKAIAFIENDTLYCRMPEYTAWEALDVDYGNSLVDIYELYGGEGNVTLSLALDIIMDFIMGDMSTSDDYLSDAFLTALKVDLYDYSSVQKYKETSKNELYSDLHSDKGSDFIEAFEDTLSVIAEPTEWYIQYYYNAIEKSFVSLAYDAYDAGQHADVTRYGEKFYEAFTEKNKTSEVAEKYFDSMDYVMLFVSAAVETVQEMKYVNATNNLVYNVMGQENLNYLGISANDNDWFTVANRYQNVLGVATTQLEAEAMQLFTDKLCWDTLIGTGVSSAAGISGGAWSFSLDFARLFVENFPLTSSTVEAFKADRRALYLSELQQNIYWVAYNTLLNMQDQRDNTEIYSKYIQALQLYCRTSIAMYENLIAMVDEFGQNRDYWSALFQERIDMLAVSLYQLTTIQDDGTNACLPLKLSTFVCNSLNANEAYSFLEKFLTSNEYRKYISDELYFNDLEYVIFDINADSIPEMLIQSTIDRPFFNTWLFSFKGESIVLVDERYGYGEYRYSPSQNAVIASPEWKPFAGTGYSPFYRLDGTNLELVFSVIQDDGVWYYRDGTNKTKISEEKHASYFTDIVWFEWLSIESLTSKKSASNIGKSTKTDLGQYLNTNIYDFISMIGNMHDVGATDGSKEFSNGTIIVSAGYDSDYIQYISIDDECEFSIKGIKYGMEFSNAAKIAIESCNRIADDLPYYKYFVLDDGTGLSIHAEDEKTVDSINLFAN